MSETQTATLTDFLLARIAEDEAMARQMQAEADQIGDLPTPAPYVFAKNEDPVDFQSFAFVEQWHPARVLAECEAKRRIITEQHHGSTDEDECPGCGADLMGRWHTGPGETCPVLALLALPYADHPDYREEWRP